MTRTAARSLAVQLCYMQAMNPEETLDSFFDREYYSTFKAVEELPTEYPDEKQLAYIRALVAGVAEKREELDGWIEKYSHGWKPSRISRTAAAVLRCALYEVVYMEDVPDPAAINEAVELSKGYDDEEIVSFVNGVLGGFMRGERGKAPDGTETAENGS